MVCAAAALAVLVSACLGEGEPQQSEPRMVPPPETEHPRTSIPSGSDESDRDSNTPVALLIEQAAALERNGYWEEALDVRDKAVSRGALLDVEQLISLRLDQVRLLLRLGRAEQAKASLPAVDDSISDELMRRYQLLSGRAALERSQWDAGLSALEEYVEAESPAWPVIAVEAALALQEAERGDEAIEWAERALEGELSSQDRLRAVHLLATEYDIAGDVETALTRYEELLRDSPWRDDQVAALSRMGALRREAGQLAAAQDAWWTLVRNYTDYEEGQEALSLLLETGASVDQPTIGNVRFAEERWDESREAMINVLGSASSPLSWRVESEFVVAAIHEENGDTSSAALGYEVVIGRDPTDPLAAVSAMRLAEIAVEDGDTASAEDWWSFVLEDHPEHWRAPEAARNWAAASVAREDWEEAVQRYRDAANIAADYWRAELQQEFLYWSALMQLEAGEPEAAADLARELVELDPGGYYSLRAASELGQESPAASALTIREWLARLTGDPDPQDTDLAGLPTYQAARDLRLSGYDTAADRMYRLMVAELEREPWGLVDAARRLAEEGEYTASVQAASQLLRLFGQDWTTAPAELLRLLYPQPWSDLVLLYAGAEGVEPELLWSLIRRESLYDPDAQGAAGEVGLTQVIPLTGGDIARGLGISYEHEQLARPELAIRFGAWYLGRQLESFGGDPLKALAAYNAGPGNAARWQSTAPLSGEDGFLAAMDFRSTRTYVQDVLETQAIYQAAWAEVEEDEPGSEVEGDDEEAGGS